MDDQLQLESGQNQDAGSQCLLMEYFDIVRRRKRILLAGALLGLAVAVLLSVVQTPVYEAQALLEIQNMNKNFLNMRDVSPTEDAQGSSPADHEIQTQVRLLQSEAVIRAVIRKLHLASKLSTSRTAGLVAACRRTLGLPAPAGASEAALLATISRKLRVHTLTNTRLIEISYEDKDPKLASEIVNTVAAEFIQQSLAARRQTAQATSQWLSSEVDNIKIRLEKSEDQLQKFDSTSGLLFVSEKNNVVEEKLRTLQQELSAAQADRIAKQSRLDLVSSAPADSLPEVLDDATLKEYQVKLTDLRRQLASLSAVLTPANPSVKKLQAQVQTLESAAESRRANIVGRIHDEFQSARLREKLLAEQYENQIRVLSSQAQKVTHYNILKHQVDTVRQLYNSMLQHANEVGVASALRASNVQVVDPATPPVYPYKPNFKLNLSLGVITGLFFSLLFVVLRERTDRTIRMPGDASLFLKMPELGVIPSTKAVQSICGGVSDGLLARSSVELVTWRESHSVLAESFRGAVESILHSGDNGNQPRVIVMTSSLSGEGKTTLATNLALALAEVGRRVLLVDADLRNPRIHQIFHLQNTWGLNDLLTGNPPPRREAMFVKTEYRMLYVLTAGSKPTNISEALHSPLASDFLDRTRCEFDAVIIDTPPVLQTPDARVLGSLADGVILVVRATGTMREDLLAARQRLVEDRTRVLGTILNQWDPSTTSRYSYGYCYGYKP